MARPVVTDAADHARDLDPRRLIPFRLPKRHGGRCWRWLWSAGWVCAGVPEQSLQTSTGEKPKS